MRIRNNKGEVMVEAAIYFPFVLMIVFFILILSIAQLNQYVINYQVAREADIWAKYGGSDDCCNSIGFSFAAGMKESELPTDADVIESYEARQHERVGWTWAPYEGRLRNAINKYSLVKGFVSAEPTISVEEGYTDIIKVRIEYDLNMPGFISYITGDKKQVVAVSETSTTCLLTTETIRRMDAMENQINNYYGGECFISDIPRYSDYTFDNWDYGYGRHHLFDYSWY